MSGVALDKNVWMRVDKEDSEVIQEKNVEAVRAKASHRKARTTQVVRAARVPAQERSKKRYQSILDAFIDLLKVSNIEDISLHDVGKAAALPPPSVHYLFKTVGAIHAQLNSYFNENLTQRVIAHKCEQFRLGNITTWQDLARSAMAFARNELNSNRPMSEVMLGPVLNRSLRLKNLETNHYLGGVSSDLLSKFFIVPNIPDIDKYHMFADEIVDGLWIGSYARHGIIDDVTFDESVRAAIAYLRCFYPETMSLRPGDAG